MSPSSVTIRCSQDDKPGVRLKKDKLHPDGTFPINSCVDRCQELCLQKDAIAPDIDYTYPVEGAAEPADELCVVRFRHAIPKSTSAC